MSDPVIDRTMAVRIATQLGWEPKREWVGLNDEEVMREFWNFYPEEYALFTDVERAFYCAIEAKLKEKNGG